MLQQHYPSMNRAAAEGSRAFGTSMDTGSVGEDNPGQAQRHVPKPSLVSGAADKVTAQKRPTDEPIGPLIAKPMPRNLRLTGKTSSNAKAVPLTTPSVAKEPPALTPMALVEPQSLSKVQAGTCSWAAYISFSTPLRDWSVWFEVIARAIKSEQRRKGFWFIPRPWRDFFESPSLPCTASSER
ncbi:uncharacterized protein EI90DRAFT_258393 [Cantharellus anzutake]|uniref:uncharacterized protein n=1 Tax=Cantharellus anzutake TaxID=1750568 RepID=UPI0019078DC5|nr:uncharacterized protein EI90DRAFT_258393 [Cantharellus anzutake]KAF8335786.1 hypothetical protein EI90DRAFT_258393 [Cantharellus anzutake]